MERPQIRRTYFFRYWKPVKKLVKSRPSINIVLSFRTLVVVVVFEYVKFVSNKIFKYGNNELK